MNKGLIATRYATALYGFAAETSAEKTVYDEMQLFTAIALSESNLSYALESPALRYDEKKTIINSAFGGKKSSVTAQFIDFLFEKNRIDFLISTALKFVELYRKKNNIHVARLITATPTNTQTEKKLLQMIEAKTGGTVEFLKETDPKILGGFIIEVDNLRWDASIARRLKEIKDKYSKPYFCD